MSKAVLISIRPKWCELIASGKKTIEVRKTAPKIETPFKCYIYCTKEGRGVGEIPYRHFYQAPDGARHFIGGTVIGEFMCDKMFKFSTRVYLGDEQEKSDDEIVSKSCVPRQELRAYEGSHFGIYGWHISDLKIYDTPKRYVSAIYKGSCQDPTFEIKRPPQSWCYLEAQT